MGTAFSDNGSVATKNNQKWLYDYIFQRSLYGNRVFS